ncbi:MAG: response regulator [Treponema sp.]|jgi:putative two-component system response regulator|nr:response regulator [Treponema sp.]
MEKKTVLAVDDMSMNLRTIKVILEGEYDILLAKSGELALDILKKTKVDLVLLDIEMPGITGFEVIDSMRDIPGCEETPVIFITSHAAPDMIVTAYDHGAGDYIVKPINAEVLRPKVHAILSKR